MNKFIDNHMGAIIKCMAIFYVIILITILSMGGEGLKGNIFLCITSALLSIFAYFAIQGILILQIKIKIASKKMINFFANFFCILSTVGIIGSLINIIISYDINTAMAILLLLGIILGSYKVKVKYLI